MRSSKKKALFRGLAVMALAAPLLVGCSDSTPTEPKVVATPPSSSAPTPTPAPMFAGTYNGISPRCDSSAQANWHQTDTGLSGTMTVPCLAGGYPFQFSGGVQGDAFTGWALWGDPEFYPLKGALSGSSLEITIFNDIDSNLSGTAMGQLHLHR
jgi:hypothetical protein